MLKALTGLEGGGVASGSTCGVVSGGAVGIALLHRDELDSGGEAAEEEVLKKAGEYVDWFRESVGTTSCRERIGVDFYTAAGQVRYFLPGDRLGRCLVHLYRSAKKFSSFDPPLPGESGRGGAGGNAGGAVHCAREVLRGVRAATGVGDDLLERLSVVFDGGIGLRGGLCGALAGGLMALNLRAGWDIRRIRFPEVVKRFVVGHLNLLRREPVGRPEAFSVGRGIVADFRKRYGSVECGVIIQKTFPDVRSFQEHMKGPRSCGDLISFAVQRAARAIEEHELGR